MAIPIFSLHRPTLAVAAQTYPCAYSQAAHHYAVHATDNTRIVESDLTSAQKYVATFVNDRWFLTAGLATGGGTGDITAVNTSATSGLSGGASSGAANLLLDVNRLTQATTTPITGELAFWESASAGQRKLSYGAFRNLLRTYLITNDALDLATPANESTVFAPTRRSVASAITGVSGSQRTFVVPDSGVGGTVDAIELTTGLSISLNDGDDFRFTPSGVNTGAVGIAVDGSPAGALYHFKNDTLRLFNAGDLIAEPVIVTYDEGSTRFLWRPQGASTSSYYEVGVGNRDIAILGMNGTFSPARFGQDGQAGRVLTWGSGAAVWADLPAGVSPITAVTTSDTSGLDGGGTNGALALSVNPNRLTSLSDAAVATDDELILYNESAHVDRARDHS